MKLPELTSAFLLNAWNGFSTVPGGKLAFSRLVGMIAPYSGTTHATVEQLEKGFARVTMKDHRRVRNHLKSIHAMALANLGELASGLALNSALPPSARAILKGFRVEYLKKARGTLTVEARQEPLADVTERHTIEVHASVRDEKGDEVTRVTAEWLVGPR